MKSKRNAELSRMSICQPFSANQIFVLPFCLLNCEAVEVKSFLLVNFLEQSSVFNHKANCVVNKKISFYGFD